MYWAVMCARLGLCIMQKQEMGRLKDEQDILQVKQKRLKDEQDRLYNKQDMLHGEQ